MKLSDHLSAFSVDDLRELARRRGIRLNQDALSSRQVLVRTLAGVLGRYESAYGVLTQLSQPELEAVRLLLHLGSGATLGRLAEAGKVEPAEAKAVLESLRLWGIVFPEGDWDHPIIAGGGQTLVRYLDDYGKPAVLPERINATPPPLVASRAVLHERPGSLATDLAELLARVARARLKVTQQQRINRRDLRAMESAFAVADPGYAEFAYLLAAASRFLAITHNDVLCVTPEAECYLAGTPIERTRAMVRRWTTMAAFPESGRLEPMEERYVPPHQGLHRGQILHLLGEIAPGTSASLASLAKRLKWAMPRSFEGWQAAGQEAATRRLVRSLNWLGLAALDDPAAPRAVGLTTLGAEVMGKGQADQVVPDDPSFLLQPTAEVFAPPNLAPRTLFHLRRLTGEKKGAPSGLYPLTQDALRRALDAGLDCDSILRFLEAFSRTNLPGTVRTLVETVGRQHGRIRLVPAGYVLVTDEPALLEELVNVKPVASMLGRRLTSRAAVVDAGESAELLRRLRQRGYAPLDETAMAEVPPIPTDPHSAPPAAEHPTGQPEIELDWSHVGPAEAIVPIPPGKPVMGYQGIVELMREAQTEGLAVEIEYAGQRADGPSVRVVHPYWVGSNEVAAFCVMRGGERHFALHRISWARLTGETFLDGV